MWGSRSAAIRSGRRPRSGPLVLSASDIDLYFGQDYTIDVSSEAGNRFDQNVTGFRAEEEMGFRAEPAVRTGRVQIVAGI